MKKEEKFKLKIATVDAELIHYCLGISDERAHEMSKIARKILSGLISDKSSITDNSFGHYLKEAVSYCTNLNEVVFFTFAISKTLSSIKHKTKSVKKESPVDSEYSGILGL